MVYDGLNVADLPVERNLTGLDENTHYFLRLFSYNEKGRSSITDVIQFTTVVEGDNAVLLF